MTTLYLGLEVPPHLKGQVVHYPIIKIIPRFSTDSSIQAAFENFSSYTHLMFTSRNAVSIFFDLIKNFNIHHDEILKKTCIAVGQRTAEKLKEYGIQMPLIAQEETAEGIIKLLTTKELKSAHVFIPQSSLARSIIADWLDKQSVTFTRCSIYDTIPHLPSPLPPLNEFDHITFTSPSTVDAFLLAYKNLPEGKTFNCIGPITLKHLQSKQR